MKHYIEGVEVTEEHIGVLVTYIPPHADGNASHKDAERGYISSFNDYTVFVRFNAATGASCNTKNLVWV